MTMINSLHDMFLEELKDIYNAEKQLLKALPKMAKAASSEELRSAFEEHLEQTKQQVDRLEQVFSHINEKPKGKTCEAMQGLVAEGEDIIAMQGDESSRDAGLIAAAQKVEHYEIASYGTLRSWANLLGQSQAASLLQQTLEEESQTDEKLTQIAESVVNAHAEQESEDVMDEEEEDVDDLMDEDEE